MSKRLLDDAVFKFIDAKLIIDGRITSTEVTRAFGLGRQKVSALFGVYRASCPENMRHDTVQRCYVRCDGFKSFKLTDVDPHDYTSAVSIVFCD